MTEFIDKFAAELNDLWADGVREPAQTLQDACDAYKRERDAANIPPQLRSVMSEADAILNHALDLLNTLLEVRDGLSSLGDELEALARKLNRKEGKA